MRVVTLLPSATEIVAALGVDPVGVSHECDYPPRVADAPAVNRSRVDPDATSEEITEQVVRAERDHGGVYEIRLDVLADVDPDLIVTQGICDVCAVDRVLVEDAVDELGLDAEILTTDPHSLGDVLDDVERIGRALGRETRATRLVASLRERIDAVERRAPDSGPRTLVFDWTDPVMVAGHWVPEMVALAGGEYGLAEPGSHARPREWADVRAFDPEVLVVAPCGFSLERARDELGGLAARDGWASLSAVENGRVYVFDGNDYVNRPGPRLVDTLEGFAAALDGREPGIDRAERLDSPAGARPAE